jgi:hypothetical protein
MPTDNVLDGCWDKVANTAQGGYHHIASNPYLTISVLAIAGLVALFLIIVGIVFVSKASQANQIQIPAAPEYKYTEIKTTTVKPAKKKSKKKTTKKKSSK